MKRIHILTLALCLLVWLTGLSQNIIIHGKNTHRKLTWSDFKGNVEMNSPFYAYTAYTVNYRYGDVRIFGESVTIGNFEVTLELDANKTWAKMDKVTDELLVHEQGHFDIGILCMRELLATYKQTNFERSNYASTIQSIFQNILRKYNEMSVQYDSETEHCRNKKEQERWNLWFKEKLSKSGR